LAAHSEARRKAACRVSLSTRWHGPDDPRTQEARRDLHAAELEYHIRRLVDQAPPLTDEQRTRLAALLAPVAGDG
jgi:hypothetical protein